MPEFTELFLQDSPLYQGALILLGAIGLAKLAPLPRHLQPFYWYQQLALSLAAKVNHPSRANSQQTTAGFLSILLILVPFWLILVFMLQLAAYPWFFEFAIVYFCLGDDSFAKEAEHYSASLQQGNKTKVRLQLAPWVARNTTNLSEVGLNKTIIEKLVSTPVYGLVAAVLFFTLGGAALLLGARMIKQLQLSWPSTNPQYAYFGKPAYYLSYALYLFPMVLWNFTLALQAGPKTLARMLRPTVSPSPINHVLPSYDVAAHALNIELGGPLQFANGKQQVTDKVMRPKVGTRQAPAATDILSALKLTQHASLIWIMAVIIIPTLWAVLRYLHHTM
ncbi:cobalamin biosynthesis protein [Shewanella sp. Isolate11]|uniref:cobalamin biosynthesis protein CobD/CbiB n=1 Tax=Shewanella sp. Isolate11 TaxID=2908530 RepID=UPI001EFCDBF9|nr:cobalamin biosynthesis protein [Shewanella sp. Isolate11]MCG9695915.1 cobalamin biosynthesis protein [Shewanella sp. Isolate11]